MSVESKIFAKLTQWQLPKDGVVAVAFSGGGDSTALLDVLLKWCKNGCVTALIVDHGLREGSNREAELAQKRAQAMGAKAKILTCKWSYNIPTTGIQEKARNARYQLLGDACREQGINMLMLGHNQDDQAETVLMRKKSGSGWRGLAGMRARSHAQIWPALRSVTIARPLLSCCRRELRDYNSAAKLKWIDDPSNDNISFARVRARKYLAVHHGEQKNLLICSKAASQVLTEERLKISTFINSNTKPYIWGGVGLLPQFQSAKSGIVGESLKYLIPAISGQSLPPNYDKRMNLSRRLCGRNFSGATLGGVRFVAGKNEILCVRDLGTLTGRGGVDLPKPFTLNPDKNRIWDGRFSVISVQDDIRVDALANWIQTMSQGQKKLLQAFPEAARGGLPIYVRDGRITFIPYVGFPSGTHGFEVRSVLAERLQALLGELD